MRFVLLREPPRPSMKSEPSPGKLFLIQLVPIFDPFEFRGPVLPHECRKPAPSPSERPAQRGIALVVTGMIVSTRNDYWTKPRNSGS